MAGFVEQKRSEIDERIAELRPAVDEFRRLEAALAALEGIASNGASAVRASATRAERKRSPSRPRRRSPTVTATATTVAKRAGRPKGGGRRSREALEAVAKQPGAMIAELAARTGIKQNYLYRVMPALEQEGKVRKQGRRWYLTD